MKNKNLFSKPFFVAYLAILCWAPLPIASARPWAWNLLSVLCLTLAAALILNVLKTGVEFSATLKKHRFTLLLFVFVPIWVSLQCLPLPSGLVEFLSPAAAKIYDVPAGTWHPLSLDPGTTQQMALLSWAFWLYYLMTLLLIDSAKRLKTLLMVIVFCGLFQALYGSFMTLSGINYSFFIPKEFFSTASTGTFVNPNHLAGYLEMTLAVGIGLLVSSLNKERTKGWANIARDFLDTLLGPKMRLRIYLALMVIALVLTRSRMGNLAFFISLPLCGALMMFLQQRISRGTVILFASLILVDLIIVGEWFGFNEIVEQLQSTDVQIEDRDELARNTLNMVRDYAVTGTGAGTFRTSFPQYQSADVAANYGHAHNDYLEFAGTFGMIGFIPLAIIVLNSLYKSMRILKARRDSLMRGTAFACLMGITSLMIHSIADFNLQMPSNGLLFVLLLALASIAQQLPGRSRS